MKTTIPSALKGHRLLDTEQLGIRWACSIRTLQNWRWQKKGPKFFHLMKRGNPVVYRLVDIEEWEKENFVS